MHSVQPSAPILLVTNDVVGPYMAGPGMRFWEFARLLSREMSVILAVPPFVGMTPPPPQPDFPAAVHLCAHAGELGRLAASARAIVTLGSVLDLYPFLAEQAALLVMDAYDPFLLAGLAQRSHLPLAQQIPPHQGYRRSLNRQLRAADFILCADERQRDYWLGALSALGRVNPHTLAADATLRGLIDVVPFGLPGRPPVQDRPVLKGVVPGIGPQTRVILWGGGLWDWFDPVTAIDALALVLQTRQDVALFFMGTRRPNLSVAPMQMAEQARACSDALGLTDRHVFFNDWVAYGDRHNYLLEADVALSLHRETLETRFAFRTRFLDALWAGLPLVVSAGDVLSEAVARHDLGRVVAPGNGAGVAAAEVAVALLEVLARPKADYAPALAALAADYRWERVAAPLAAFCRDPRPAPDRAYLSGLQDDFGLRTPWQRLPSQAWQSLRDQGPSGLARQIRDYVRWRMG